MIKIILIVATLMFNLFALSHAEIKIVPLLKNPFIKPSALVDLKDERRPITTVGEILTDRNLRATLYSNEGSIANVDGIMVFVGDRIKGYTLISVGEGSATFVKNNKEITLSVSELHKKLKQ